MGRKSSFANFLYFLVKIWAEKVILGMDFTLILLYPLYSPSRSIIVTNRIIMNYALSDRASCQSRLSHRSEICSCSNLSSSPIYFYFSLLQFSSTSILIFHVLKASVFSVCCQTFRKELWKYSVLALLLQLPTDAFLFSQNFFNF